MKEVAILAHSMGNWVAMEALRHEPFDLAFCDLKLGAESGLDLLVERGRCVRIGRSAAPLGRDHEQRARPSPDAVERGHQPALAAATPPQPAQVGERPLLETEL